MSVNFLIPPNQKGPPLWWKKLKIVRKLYLIAQKERLDALNAAQKTPALYKVWVLKKSSKTSNNFGQKWNF